MIMDDNNGQMLFGDPVNLKRPDICLTGEEKTRKNLTQETCPDRGSNPGPLRDKRACYHLIHTIRISMFYVMTNLLYWVIFVTSQADINWNINKGYGHTARRPYFLAFNAQCANLREIYFYKQWI